ncbi:MULTISPECIES: DUF4083 family protein [Bacillus]|uniref:DUF4083 domain-containing protein n=1 Tax=Bacillus pseudomycoides TaxID=64104 RepID=A0A1Y3M5U8_9BACI|nr:DUF4083 family protein [Bacillus pseudomycoides]OOG94236.1 hypothetical protein BTH41_01935 [Bacillus mycoides]MDF2086726.1 DUF4083 family protein [Bacillus pseudomycoides]OUM45807.1 DUF4083 domain-containing protein [Bacillus pseudomycoides]PEL25466.1 DUF4083 domain-containing protein [Bacillus pseudomycoides]PGE78380.1 DUF4083 domain-containing protein [Bacillus pseudomycoides]
MPLENSIYYIEVAIILVIIGAMFGGIIRIIRHTSNRKKQDPVEQKLDRVIQLLEKQNKD